MMETNKFMFPVATRCVLSGPSASGKTMLMRNIIKHCKEIFEQTPERIIYTYKYAQPWFKEFESFVEFTKEVPTDLDGTYHSLIVLDDLICDPQAMKDAVSLFVRGSHHLKCSVFILTQNLFACSAQFRTISLNASHFILFKTVRGFHQIENFGRQVFGSQAKDFVRVYKEATSAPFSYLLLDLTPEQDYRLRSNIFPFENEIVYILE